MSSQSIAVLQYLVFHLNSTFMGWFDNFNSFFSGIMQYYSITVYLIGPLKANIDY